VKKTIWHIQGIATTVMPQLPININITGMQLQFLPILSLAAMTAVQDKIIPVK